ncbi:MAG: WD40/YVTN/BNR-like repeat-containing protein [Marinicella sp.]
MKLSLLNVLKITLVLGVSTLVYRSYSAFNSTGGNSALVLPPEQELSKPAAAYQRQQYFLDKRLPGNMDQLPMDPYREAINSMANQVVFSTQSGRVLNQAEKKQSKAQLANTAWEWLGPGNIGGRTRALLFHPTNHEVMYAAGVSGGVWKTENAGQMWQPLADNMANINVGALAIDQVDPNTLYAGTGELYRKTLRPYSSMTGAGIFKTTDGGETWFQLDVTINEDFLYVSDIVISPNDHKRLFVATNSGVWRSEDGGITFEQSLNPVDQQGQSIYEGCNDLSIRTDKADDWLLVSCASRSTDDRYYLPGLLPEACNGPCDARIYVNPAAQTSDNWQMTLTEPGMGRTEMSIHLANQDIIYASSANTDGGPDFNNDGNPDLHNGLHAIFRSNDGGLTWHATLRNTSFTLLNTQLFSYADTTFGAQCNRNTRYYSAGWYNQAIVVNPVDPNVVWVGGMEIYRSDDGGKNFGMASDWDADWHAQNSNNPAYLGAYVHADQHVLKFHPEYDGVNNRIMYAANDGGIFLTDDDSPPVKYGTSAPCLPSTTGVQWRSINNNYGITQFYAGDVFSDGKSYLAGAQDNGTLYGSDDYGVNDWFEVYGGDGADLAINPIDDNNFYVASQNANIQRTTDGGNNFTSLWNLAANSPTVTPWHDSSASPNRIFITPYEIDYNQPNRLFLGGQRLWRSDDQGNSWHTASPELGVNYNDLISALAVAPGNSNRVIYANNTIIAVVNNALSNDGLFNISFSRPRTGWVSSLAFEPGNQDVAYATYSTFGGKHVWKSTNGGIRWSPIDGSGAGQLPDVPVHKIVIDPDNDNRLYIGTDLGVFVSIDGGENWAVENTGFSQVIVEDLVIREPRQGGPAQLFAFTYGRGVWRVPLTEFDAQPDFVINDNVSGIWYNRDQSGHGLQLEVIELNGVQAILAAWYVYHEGQPIWLIGVGEINDNEVTIDLNITDNTGFPVADFQASDIQQTPWGNIKLILDTDQSGQLIWSSILPEFNNGSMAIERLTQIANKTTNLDGINACHSGSWFDPSQDGHGFMTEVIQAGDGLNLLMTWYTYVDGRQYWLLANGPIIGDSATLTAITGSGTDFPTDFAAEDVVLTDWGGLTFTLLDNNNVRISWDSVLPGFPADEIDVTRLTQLSGYPCQ